MISYRLGFMRGSSSSAYLERLGICGREGVAGCAPQAEFDLADCLANEVVDAFTDRVRQISYRLSFLHDHSFS